ncbi:MAG: patatin-like phospholipase family protein, partial [Chitinivorax sp.]
MPLWRSALLWLAVCGLLAPMQASAQASVQAKVQKKAGRPTVGLVLGGGGARGLAHVGVLKVLEQQRVPVDCIAGTSMGALVGGVFATGMPVAEMERRVREADWDEFFSNRIKRQEEVFVRKEDDRVNTSNLRIPARNGRIGLPRGAVRTQKIELFIRELTQSLYPENFSALPIPFRAIGTDLENGRVVEFDRGDLALAMRASMSVPGLFDPVEYKGRLVVDGGLARNLPVDNVLALCNPDVLIVVNVGTPPLNREEMSSALGVTQQMVDVGINNNIAQQLSRLTSNDILIEPKLGDLTSGDFNRNAEFIPLGEQAA